MSNYRTHTYFNLFVLLPVAAAFLHYYIAPPLLLTAIFSTSFVYGTLFMSPDMDLAHQIRLLSVRGVLTIPFRSYSRVFSHRGISHSILFGTVTRIAWLTVFILVILFAFFQLQPETKTFQKYIFFYQKELIAAFVGLFLADLGHLFLDYTS